MENSKLYKWLTKPIVKRIRTYIGVFAVAISIVFAVWLLLYIFGYTVNLTFFGKTFSFADTVRMLAEVVVGALLLAALAFL